MTEPTIYFHHNKFHFSFRYDELLVAEVKACPSRWYDKLRRCWVLDYSDELRELCLRWNVQGWADAYEECFGRFAPVPHLDAALDRAIAKDA